jgi:DNA-binding IclR family transcriptional regulator
MDEKRKQRRRGVWREALAELARLGRTVTVRDLAGLFDGSRSRASSMAIQLRRWGYLRHVGFENTESGRGRRLKAYEVTPKAVRYLEWLKTGRRTDDEQPE